MFPVGGSMLGLAGAAAVVAAIWIAGNGIAGGRPPAERFAAGVLGMIAVAVPFMVQPLVGVSVLGHRVLVAALLVALLAVLAIRGRRTVGHANVRWLPILAGGVPSAVVAMPLLASSPVMPFSDSIWHEGWIRQLVGGVESPDGPYSGVSNGYPWLYHAFAALAEVLPGGLAEMFWALQAYAAVALITGLWLLAQELFSDDRVAAWTVFLGTACGGVGWIWIHKPTVVRATDPEVLRALHGDFVASASITPALSMLPPVMPRDLALALLPLALWVTVRTVTARSAAGAACTGAIVAILFLTGPVSAVVAAAIAVVLAALHRLPIACWAASAAAFVVVSAPWVGPLMWNYAHSHGFRPKEPKASVQPADAVTGLGVVVPLAMLGVWMLIRDRRHRRTGLPIAAIPLGFCVVTYAVAGTTLLGIAPIIRFQRYLPALALVLTVPASLGVVMLLSRLGRARLAGAAGIVAAASASTVLAAVALIDNVDQASHNEMICNGNPALAAGQTAAVVRFSDPDRAKIDDLIFRTTGAYVFYRPGPPRVRFKDDATRGELSQRRRKQLTDEMARSGLVPAGIAWVIEPRGGPQPPAASTATECIATWASGKEIRLSLYRVGVAD